MRKIDTKYRISTVGRYNAGVYTCPHCDCDICNSFYNHVCGFSEAPIGIVKITECPNCHAKYYSHASEDDYDLFLMAVKEGENPYFK